MNNRIIILLALSLIGIISCGISPTMNFEVINHSKENISNIQITATGSSEIETIEFNNDNKLDYELDMSDVPKTDGAYMIEFIRDGEIENKTFGYYTNGYPVNSKYIIDITDNEISIKAE